jgi:hypothetical protein
MKKNSKQNKTYLFVMKIPMKHKNFKYFIYSIYNL